MAVDTPARRALFGLRTRGPIGRPIAGEPAPQRAREKIEGEPIEKSLQKERDAQTKKDAAKERFGANNNELKTELDKTLN